ncbi:MAG: DUF2807 domain-containing protein [Bacteroidetes bacterium]|nr:DUF2807 domain-containing protein [Bacteroidota bacterium]
MKTITKSEVAVTTALFLLISSLVLILLLSGCTYERIEGNNHLTNEMRNSDPFDEVISFGDFQVNILPDSVTTLEIKAESNILPYLYTISDGSTLRIGYRNGFNIHAHFPVEVIVHTPHARILRLQGSGSIKCNGFNEPDVKLYLSGSGSMNCGFSAGSLKAEIAGSGEMELSGSVTSSDFRISGSGNIQSLEMPQKSCSANISGSGDVYVAASEQLDVHISGSGNVYYSGEPQISSSISGSGKVKKY